MNDTPVESLTPPRRPRGGFGPALVGGLAVHLVAALVFLLVVAADIEGCDRGDGAGGALFGALVVDLVGTGVLLWQLRRRLTAGRWSGILLGYAASTLPALIALLLVVRWMNSLGTGCPV